MSQPGTGDTGGNGFPSAKKPQNAFPNQFYASQWPENYNYGYNYYPAKPTNPHMAAAMQSSNAMHMGYMNQMQYYNGNAQPAVQNQSNVSFCQYPNYGKPTVPTNNYPQQQQYMQFQQHPQQNYPQQYYMNNCQNLNQNAAAAGNHNHYQNYHSNEHAVAHLQHNTIPCNQYSSSTFKDAAGVVQPNVNEQCSEYVRNSVSCGSDKGAKHVKAVSPLKSCKSNGNVNPAMGNSKGFTRCDSTKCETPESSCSSVSTEGSNESVQKAPSSYVHTLSGQYVHNQNGQMQTGMNMPVDSDSNNNMNFRNYMNSQQLNVIQKGTNAYCDQQTSMQGMHMTSPADFRMRPHMVQQQQQQPYPQMPVQNSQMARPMVPPMNNFHPGMQCYPNQMQVIRPNYNMSQPMMQQIVNPRMPFQQQQNIRHYSNPMVVSQFPNQSPNPQIGPTTTSSVPKVLPPPTVVPYGWKRVNNSGQVEYISPSGEQLTSHQDVANYLLTNGTCKCGLPCPLKIETTFCFDSKVPHRDTSPNDLKANVALCNHRRKLAISLAEDSQNQVKKEDGRKKRKRKTVTKEPTPTQTTAEPQSNWQNNQMENQKMYNSTMPHHNMVENFQGHAPNQTGFQSQNHKYLQQGSYMVPGCSYGASQNHQNFQNNAMNYPYNYQQQPSCSNAQELKADDEPVAEKVKKKRTTTRPRKKQKTSQEPTPTDTIPPTGPSFMEDPNGYMAQQTALLKNTMAGGGVGQFSPQGSSKAPVDNNQKVLPKLPDVITSRACQASPAVVPLPSNVRLPARVSKNVSEDKSPTSSLSSPVHSVDSVESTSVNPVSSVTTMESSSGNHSVTVTTTSSPCSSHKSDDPNGTPDDQSSFKTKKFRQDVCSSLDDENANKPLMPGNYTSSSQSPLEMVQNIVSSIPVPNSPKDASRVGPPAHHQISNVNQLSQQTVVGTQVFNVAPHNVSVPGVVYNTTSVIRSGSSLVVHGGSSNHMPILPNSNANVVVVTSPFTSKSTPSSVPCNTVSSLPSVMGVPQVQMQSSVPGVQHIQQVQPMVQLVNAFTAMQTPVIIQNGNNIIQQHPISNHNGMIGHSIIPTSGTTFVGQSIVPAPAILDSNQNQQIQVAKISPVSSESHDELSSNRLTPVGSGSSNRSTPQGTPNSLRSETPTSGCSSGGRKRKKRNPSTPQASHISQNIMPAIIMGKQIPQQILMNQQVPAYNPNNQVDGSHPQQRPINVVQMVGGPVTGALPVHVQQTPTIIVPSANSGIIINQLPDGTFMSTDPNTGMSYPVQLQLSGSHIVGVAPNTNSNVLSPFSAAPQNPTGTMVVSALRSPNQSNNKVINISSTPSNVYTVPMTQQVDNGSNTSVDVAQQHAPSTQSYVSNTVLQQKTTIVAQQTTVVATQNVGGTHSSVSTQTPAALCESDVTSSDCVSGPVVARVSSISPSHQSAEVTTTRQDEEGLSSPEIPQVSPIASARKVIRKNPAPGTVQDCFSKGSVVWGAHNGQPNWPALLLDQAGGEAVIRWFGDEIVDQIKKTSLSSQPSTTSLKTRRRVRGLTALENALQQLQQYTSSCGTQPEITSSETVSDLGEPSESPRKRKK